MPARTLAAMLVLAALTPAARAEPVRLDAPALDRIVAGASFEASLTVGSGPLAGTIPPAPAEPPGWLRRLAAQLGCARPGRSCR